MTLEIEELIKSADELAKRQDAAYQERLSANRIGPAPGQEDWYSPAAEGDLTPVPEAQEQGELELAAG